MVRAMKSHQEEDEEEFVSRTTNEGRSGDRKANTNRSKHSETEQRRRSKINERVIEAVARSDDLGYIGTHKVKDNREGYLGVSFGTFLGTINAICSKHDVWTLDDVIRFQILRELIPENDPKKDRATFLLEVIQYIQFLQEKVQMYEGTYQGWSHEPSKLIPWRNNGAVESLVDQSQPIRNGPGNMLVTPTILTSTQNSIDSDFSCEATYRTTDHGAATQGMHLSMPVAANMFEGGTAEPRGSFSDIEHLASQSQPRLWHATPGTTACATTSYTPDEPEELETENIGISDACSQGLLNTLSHALESSGMDLSQMSISVQLDVAKRGDSGVTSTTFCTKDNKNLCPSNQVLSHYEVGSSGEDSDQAHKRQRTEQG